MDFNQKDTYVGNISAKEMDLGLQAHMQKVYYAMCFGLVITGLTAFGVSSSEYLMNAIFGSPLKWVVMLAPLGIIWLGLSPARVQKMSPAGVHGVFLLLTVVYGLSFSVIFHVFTADSIARVFFITAGMFAATSLYGYTTKKNLATMGSFMFMGLIGVIIASVVNMFIQSTMMDMIISVIAVIVFTGLTAWDTQNIKESYSSNNGSASNEKMAVMGAVSLFINFVALFMNLMTLMGDRE